MDPEFKASETPTSSPPNVSESSSAAGDRDNSVILPAAGQSSDQLQQIWAQISTILSKLPEYLTDFFSEYKSPLVTLGLIFAALLAVKMVLAMLDAVDDIPLMAPAFELIGFGYVVWFCYRYLLRASNRQELSKDVDQLKDQIIGNLKK